MRGHPPSEQKVRIHHHQLGQGSKCVANSECKQGVGGPRGYTTNQYVHRVYIDGIHRPLGNPTHNRIEHV